MLAHGGEVAPMSDLFGTTPQKRHGHPNTLLIGDMDRGVSRDEMRRRFESGEYRGCHKAYLTEAGIGV